MTFPYLLSFKKNLGIRSEAEDLLIINPAGSAVRMKSPSKGIRELLYTLTGQGGTEEELCDVVTDADGPQGIAKSFYYLQKFDQKGFLRRTIILDNSVLATLIPVSPDFNFFDNTIEPGLLFTLSRFAFCRNDNCQMILESPLGHGKLELGRVGMQILAELSTPVSISKICTTLEINNEKAIQAFFALLLNINAIEKAASPKISRSPRETALAQWDFHDLVFHTHTRSGRTDTPLGGTFRFLGKIDPLPAVKPKMAGERIALFRPDLDELEREDPTLTHVLEKRQSVRDYSLVPMTIDQLGEFLFRSCRIKTVHDPAPDQGAHYQSTHRPSPSGGAMHGLEIYPVINECDGIEQGLFHYDPMDHELERLSRPNEFTEKLLDHACMASNLQYEPGVLFVVTARFQRPAWKYESMAYALILKDLGALYQTFYLVATAMNLAPCALGAGNSDLFARAAGLDYYAETSVGEFLLGSRRD